MARRVRIGPKTLGRGHGEIATVIWLRAQRDTIPIIGARKLAQLTDNLDCVKWSLNAKQLAQLNAVCQIVRTRLSARRPV
jgi:aryl-alcohol dehydrogenase-like predicted oxidoreductase